MTTATTREIFLRDEPPRRPSQPPQKRPSRRPSAPPRASFDDSERHSYLAMHRVVHKEDLDVDDGLKDDAQILFVHHPVHCQVGMALRIVERGPRWSRRAPGRPLLRRL